LLFFKLVFGPETDEDLLEKRTIRKKKIAIISPHRPDFDI